MSDPGILGLAAMPNPRILIWQFSTSTNFKINIAIYYYIPDLTTVYLTRYDKITKYLLDYFQSIYSHTIC